MAIKGSELFY